MINMENNRICPECKSVNDINDKFCINCGFPISNEHSDRLLQIKNQINSFYTFCQLLETILPDPNKYPLITRVKITSGNNFRGIFINDVFKFLCYLGVADGVFEDDEVSLINYIFDTNWTKFQIIQLMDIDLDKYLNSLPLSFMIFHEGSLNFKVFVDSNGRPAPDLLLDLYEELGDIFINIDDDLDQGEDNLLSKTLSALSIKLDEYKQNGQ